MSFVDLGGDGAHEVEVPLEPVLDATHYKTTTLADLDDFDPALLFASLPQPYRTISKVLEGIWEESWAKIEERHPEVVVSLGGQARAPPRDLENLAVARRRAPGRSGARALARRRRRRGGARRGHGDGSLLLYEPTAPREAEDDGGAGATLGVFDSEEGLALSVATMSAISDREPERPFRVVVSAGDPVPRPAEGDDGAAAPPEPEPQGGGKVAIVEVWPSDAPPGPRLSLLTTFETPSRPLALTLARDGRWLALTLSDGSTALHRLPSMAAMPDGDVDRKMERISEEQAVEWRAEYDKDLADVGRPTFALPAPERPTRALLSGSGAKAPSRPATPAPAEGDELDEEPPVEVPTFHFVGCYSAAEGCATDASVVEVRASSNVVRKHGLGALPPPPAEGEGAPRPPQLASWALPAAATASAVAVDAARADEHAVLALGLATGAVLLWDLHLDLCRRVLKRHQAPVTSIAVHRHKYLVAGAGDGRLHVYDLAVPGEARAASGAFVATEPALVACRADLAAPVTKVLCLDVAALAVAADGKGSLALYDLANDGVLGCLSLGDGQAPRSDGDHAVAAGDDASSRRRPPTAGARLRGAPPHPPARPGVNAAAGGESDP
ncbi:hypothetical protein JL722_1193 [Aureococcus anophagefferens]|nr:hypothetical protein JL722_1193 [Aureococcus anophagefferens]